jgi:competence protein ComEA
MEDAEVAALAVHVSGWVATPGVVRVPSGSIVADAVAAAGGARQGALLDAVNLAAPVLDGDHVQIPGPGEETAASVDGGGAGPISLNRADAAALETLPGVGPVLAERIIAHRESNGPFQSVDDLLEVPGIGEAKLASLRDLVTVP